MKHVLWNKLLVAILSTLIYAFLFTYIATKFQQETWIVMYVILIFVGPCYLVGGILFTTLIDSKVHNRFIQLILYLISGGIVSMIVFQFILHPPNTIRFIDSLYTSIYGITAALLFWIIQMIVLFIRKRYKNLPTVAE